MDDFYIICSDKFLSTPSARRATIHCRMRGERYYISIHALREEGDIAVDDVTAGMTEFLSTPSARRATGPSRSFLPGCRYFYPRPPRGGRRGLGLVEEQLRGISIHALREEGDVASSSSTSVSKSFLSTPSARRATRCFSSTRVTQKYFYPRPPRGGRQDIIGAKPDANQFLSTPSARRATAKTETKSLFSNKLYNILHEFRRALIYNGSKNYPNHAK